MKSTKKRDSKRSVSAESRGLWLWLGVAGLAVVLASLLIFFANDQESTDPSYDLLQTLPRALRTKWKRLIDWNVGHEGRVHPSLKIRYVNDAYGLGAFATAGVKKGEQLFSLPVDAVWKVRSPHSPPEHAQVIDYIQEQGYDTPIFLAAVSLLLDIAEPESFWRAYFDTLPAPHGIFYYSDDELQALQSNHAASLRREYQDYFIGAYTNLLPELETEFPKLFPHGGRDQSLEAFLFALHTLYQRGFQPGADDWYLIPVFDVMNHNLLHHPQRNEYEPIGKLSETKGRIHFDAAIEASGGQEVFFTYSTDHTSVQFLLQYNFVMENNLNDFLLLRLALSPEDPHFIAKRNSFVRLGFADPSIDSSTPIEAYTIEAFSPIKSTQICVESAFLDAVSVALSTAPPDFASVPGQFHTATPERKAAYEVVVESIRRGLGQMPTTQESDQRYLAEHGRALGPNMHTAIAFRIETKRLLRNVIDALSTGVAICRSKPSLSAQHRRGQSWDVHISAKGRSS